MYLIPNATAIITTIPIIPKKIVVPALGNSAGKFSVSLTLGVISELLVFVAFEESV